MSFRKSCSASVETSRARRRPRRSRSSASPRRPRSAAPRARGRTRRSAPASRSSSSSASAISSDVERAVPRPARAALAPHPCQGRPRRGCEAPSVRFAQLGPLRSAFPRSHTRQRSRHVPASDGRHRPNGSSLRDPVLSSRRSSRANAPPRAPAGLRLHRARELAAPFGLGRSGRSTAAACRGGSGRSAACGKRFVSGPRREKRRGRLALSKRADGHRDLRLGVVGRQPRRRVAALGRALAPEPLQCNAVQQLGARTSCLRAARAAPPAGRRPVDRSGGTAKLGMNTG